MKRQGLIITINELKRLIEELYEEFDDGSNCWTSDDNRKFQINIINKTPECSDTWKIEDFNQRKKDKDDGSNVSLSGNPKQLQRKTNKDEHMSVEIQSVSNALVCGNHVDTDAPRKTSNEATPIDGRRLKSKGYKGE